MKLSNLIPATALATAMPLVAFAQDAEVAVAVPTDSVFIFNSLLFLIGGFLVFFMAAGFSMLEAGLVRSKNVTTQLTKNVALFGLASIFYYLIGYNLMYPLSTNFFAGGVVDTDSISWAIYSLKENVEVDGETGTVVMGYLSGLFGPGVLEAVGVTAEGADDYSYASTGSDFFFQLMFCAATASIVSGTVAERIKLWPFLIFTVILTAIIYPITASWTWGGGFVGQAGFSDFAGSTIVHSVGGWAALTGAIILGPRLGKYKDGKVTPFPGSNLPLATLGTFILWMGWFGFNGGSQLAMGSVGDVADVSRIFSNTNAAAAGGAVAALLLTQILYKKADLTMVLNGALAGLVSITAEPLAPSLGLSTIIGMIGGVLVVVTVPLLDKFKIDDVVGAIPVHLVCGIWGTLAVVLTGTATIGDQLFGIVVIGLATIVASAVVWFILKATVGIRVSEEAEINGLDVSELGMEAYPEFSKG